MAPAPDEEISAPRPRLGPLDLALLTFTCTLYALTSSPTLQGHDSPEWVNLSLHGGVAHPPGYPLYTLLLQLAGTLPLPLGPAHRMSLLSAALMSMAVVVLSRALIQRNAHPFTARVAALAFGLTLPAWRLAGVPEVFAGLALNGAAFLYVLHWIDNAEELLPRHGAALGAVVGAGMAHHHSVALLLPLLVPLVLFPHARAGFQRWSGAAAAAAAAALLVVGAAWTGTLLLTREGSYCFSDLHSPIRLLWHVLRVEYGTLSSSRLAGSWSLDATGDLLVDTLAGFHILAPLALAALKGRRGWPVALCWLLTGPWLLGTFTLDQDGTQVLAPLETRERFEILPLLLTAVLASDALAALAFKLPQRKRPLVVRAYAGVLCLSVGAAGAVTLPQASWRGETALERTLLEAVDGAPRNAAIVAGGDAWQFGLPFVAQQRGRNDLLILDFPRAFTGDRPDPQAQLLLRNACGEMPCPPENWPQALRAVALHRPVLFFPAGLAHRLGAGAELSVVGLFSMIGGPPPSLGEQAQALARYQEGRVPGIVDDPRRYWQAHAIAVWGEPWMVLHAVASRANDTDTQRVANEQLQSIIARVVPAARIPVDGSHPAFPRTPRR
jgi:hypothetical protein